MGGCYRGTGMLHHPDDKKWIMQQLARLPDKHKNTAMKGYDKVFREVFDATPLAHQKDGEARRAANTRLRRYVDAITKKPPHSGGGKGTA